MKPAILLLALLSPITARGQNPVQTMTDKLCDQQGKIYVTEKNKEESAPEPGRSFYWSFVAVQYDSRTNSCYVMYNRFVSGLGTVLEQVRIDDIEGNRIAGYSGTWHSNLNGRPAYSKPSECEVNGTSCESKSEFDELVGKFIPVRSLTPSAEGLRKRFGVADSGNSLPDVFVLGPNLKLSVRYGSDRLACHISIEPVDIGNPYLPKEKVSELIDELASAAMRGRAITGYGEFRSSECGGVGMAAYENVFIGRWPNYCVHEHPDTEKQAVIQFTRSICPNPYVKTESRQPNSR